MNVTDKLSQIRQHLHQAKSISGQARHAFGKVEKSSEQAASLLGAISKDVFESGLSNRRGAIFGAGQRAEQKLGEVVEHHGQVVEDLGVLFDADPAIADSLYTARQLAEGLGLPTNSTWLLRNAIDSAQREEDYAARSTNEIDRSLLGLESELDAVLSSAGELGKAPPRWGGSLGRWRHRHRYHHDGGGWRGQKFRERWQARASERRMRAREIDEVTSKLDNPFQDIDRSCERGARHQAEVSNYVDQALKWVDQLERDYLVSQNKPKPPVATPPNGARPPRPAPPAAQRPTAPPVRRSPGPTPVTPPVTPPAVPPSAPAPEPGGFFKKPWRS